MTSVPRQKRVGYGPATRDGQRHEVWLAEGKLQLRTVDIISALGVRDRIEIEVDDIGTYCETFDEDARP